MKLFRKTFIVGFIIIIGWIKIATGQTGMCGYNSFNDPYYGLPDNVYMQEHHIYKKCVKIKNIDILSPEYKLIAVYHEAFSDAHMYEVEEDVCLKGTEPLSFSETKLYIVKHDLQNQRFCTRQELKNREKDNEEIIVNLGRIDTDGDFISNKSEKTYENKTYKIIQSGDTYKLQTVSTKTNVLPIKNIIIFIINILLLYITSYFTVKDQNKKKILINSILLPTIIFGTIFLTIQFIPQQLIYRLLLGIASLIIAFLLTKFLLKTKRKYALINGFICLISTLLLVRLIWG